MDIDDADFTFKNGSDNALVFTVASPVEAFDSDDVTEIVLTFDETDYTFSNGNGKLKKRSVNVRDEGTAYNTIVVHPGELGHPAGGPWPLTIRMKDSAYSASGLTNVSQQLTITLED
jgi:hypothetical protein